MRFVGSLVAVVILAIAAFATYGTPWSLFLAIVLGIAANQLWQSAKEQIETLRNSIGGAYDTLTTGSSVRDPAETVVEGKIARKLRLDQRGTRVKGVERGGATMWSLAGEVRGEFVFGTWAQTTPASALSMGAFHLSRDPQNPLRFAGRWVGWEPVKGVLGGGEWEWVRQGRRA